MNLPSRLCLIVCALSLTLEAGAKPATEVFEEVSGSVVVVYGKNREGQVISLGSGVALSAGEVITNCHVIAKASDLSVRHKDSEHPATRKHSDFDRDVCSLAVPGLKAPVAKLGTTKALKVGQRVYAIGAPRGLELTLSEGIISSLREIEGGRYIQITAPISAGSSGGGLFDEEGRLIGLPTFYLSEGQQLNFAVPVEWVKALPQRAAAAKETAAITAWISRAIELERKNDWAGLLRHAHRWTQAKPDAPAAWYFLGIAYQWTGKAAQAIKAYQQALRIEPDFAGAWSLLGLVYENTGYTTEAIEAYQQALRIKPDDAFLWFKLGETYKRAGQITQAIEAFQQAVRVKPDYEAGWRTLGDTYEEAGKMAQAIETYHQALRIDPDSPGNATIWLRLVIAYSETGQVEEEIKIYQQALRIEPDAATIWRRLGVEYYLNGRSKDKLMEVYRRLKKLDPQMADEFFNEYILPTSGTSDTPSRKRLIEVGKVVELIMEPLGLYKEPSRESERLQRLYKKDALVVEQVSGDWLKVRTPDGVHGWIMKSWVGNTR